jgi:predicted anti-sigma-YlaC factor YlaD
MAVTHLTDEQIQRYLDGDRSLPARDAKRHLQQCEECRLEVEVYAQVYEGLKEDTAFELPPGFVDTVVGRLPCPASGSARVSLAGLILIILGSIAALCAGIYFMRGISLTKVLEGLSAGIAILGSSFAETLQVATPDVGIRVELLLFAGFILCAFAVLERVLLWSRGRHYCL